jgi:GST-like protein
VESVSNGADDAIALAPMRGGTITDRPLLAELRPSHDSLQCQQPFLNGLKRPCAGRFILRLRSSQESPVIKFYFNLAPNPMKVALLLEELGVAYEPIPVDTRKGEQFAPDYQAINPNGKVHAILDGDAGVFDSNAILLYLAEKTARFLAEPKPAYHGQLLSWLMFVASGIGPYSGQAVHFRHHAPEPKEYALNRYDFEAERHYSILDARLGIQRYMVGSSYTIVDMAVWGWARLIPHVMGSPEAWSRFPNPI